MMSSTFARAFAAAALIGGLTLASPSFAMSGPGPTGSSAGAQAASPSSQVTKVASKSTGKKAAPSPEDMSERVETRIQTLHDKLKITPDQESEWNDVAQAMRDNESNISDAIQARHANATSMTAVEDLESYQKIAQAHADGTGKVISAFSTLYDDMSDDQKKNADQVFGQFEGHRGVSKASAKGGMKKMKPAGSDSAE